MIEPCANIFILITTCKCLNNELNHDFEQLYILRKFDTEVSSIGVVFHYLFHYEMYETTSLDLSTSIPNHQITNPDEDIIPKTW